MPANKSIQALVAGLIAYDEQPSEESLTELRQALGNKVSQMKQRGRGSSYLFAAGISIMATGIVLLMIASAPFHQIVWLTRTGFGFTIVGAVLVIIASIGLLIFRGFGYVWARHDFHDAAIMELSMQIRRLSEQLDAMQKSK